MLRWQDVLEKLKFAVALLLSVVILGGVLFTFGTMDSGKEQISVESYSNDNIELVTSGITEWKYLDDGSNPAPGFDRLAWTKPEYDDSSWKTASGDFGCRDGELKGMYKEKVPEVLLNHYKADGKTQAAVFFRAEINVENPEKIRQMTGSIFFDDTVVMYINGIPVYTGNVPEGGFQDNQEYGGKSGSGKIGVASFCIDDTSMLKKGTNVIAVELHQDNDRSTDAYFDLEQLIANSMPADQSPLDLSEVILEPVENEKSVKINWTTQEDGSYIAELVKEKEKFEAGGRLMGSMYAGKNIYSNTVTFSNLEYDTVYKYQIRKLGSKRKSKTYSFRTGTGERGFTFLALGDAQIGSGELLDDADEWNSTIKRAKADAPKAELLVSLGDQSDSKVPAEMAEEQSLFRKPELLKEVPIAVIQGNHEAREEVADIYEKQFSREEEDSLGDYSFTWQNTLFVALNTNNRDYEKQQKFLHDAIEREKPEWVVVLMHYSIFSSGSHAEDESMAIFRRNYSRIMEAENVDLVLSGHDHIYTRSYLMKGEIPQLNAGGKKREGETLYLTLPSSTGSKFYDRAEIPLSYVAFEQEATIGYAQIQVSEENIVIEMRKAEDGSLIDSYTLSK